MRRALKHFLRRVTAPAFRSIPLKKWPGAAGRIHDLTVPKGVTAHAQPEPRGAANINVLLEFLDRTSEVPGAIAECGVYRGCTLIPMALYLEQTGSEKPVYGFDSFEGFGDVIRHDGRLEAAEVDPNMRQDGFSDTSYALVNGKVKLFGLARVELVPGFFSKSLSGCTEKRFSYVHLDCDAYESYRDCLNHFYPLMSEGGIISLDEYNDPPWPGCNQAVDEFLSDKPERLEEICRDNHIKYYFVKRSAPGQAV